MRIHLIVNISWIVQYRDQVGGQKKKEVKLVEVGEVGEQEVERIINKRKIRKVIKYLVRWKRFIVEHDSWEKEEDLENMKELVAEFEEKMSAEVRRQEKLDMAEEKDFRRGELLRKYMAKILYRWDNGKFKSEYLKKLERNWKRWKEEDKTRDEPTSSSRSRSLEGKVMSDIQSLDTNFFI